VAYDYGVKRNILRLLVEPAAGSRCSPRRRAPAEALALKPDGVFLSNGPGVRTLRLRHPRDPRNHRRRRADLRHLPGHQLMGLASGAKP